MKIRDVTVEENSDSAISLLPGSSEAQSQARRCKITEFPIRIAPIEIELPNVLYHRIGVTTLDITSRNDAFKITTHIHSNLQLAKISANRRMTSGFVMMRWYHCR